VASFVAPKAPAPGTPSPEAVQRLQAAVQRAPGARQSEAQPAAQPQENRPRFGINSLINRMTGHHAEPAQEPRQQPPVQGQSYQEPAADPEHERVEIPAFLRRQAN
jgi:cell division protein FtsZ